METHGSEVVDISAKEQKSKSIISGTTDLTSSEDQKLL
jgi:hypothetical protein